MGDWLDDARENKRRLCAVLDQLALRYIELDDFGVGVGLALEWATDGAEARIVVVTIMGPPNENTALVTSGVLADVAQDRLAILDVCNTCVSENAAFPVYLHDADAGWDVLLQTSNPMQLFVDVPPFFKNLLQRVPMEAERIRGRMREETNVAGRPYAWEDLDRLFQRSMV